MLHDNALQTTTPAPAQGGVLAWLLTAAGVLGATIASSCCIVPLVLVSVGVTGTWIGSLMALEPYKPYMLTVTALFLAGGFWQVYAKPCTTCAEDSYCARPAVSMITKTVLWLGTALAVLSATVNFWAPLLY